MIVGVLEVSLHIPDSSSLKDKRKIIRSLKDRIRHKFNVSLAETDGQNTWQLSVLAFAMVAAQQSAIERDLDLILKLIESEPALLVADYWMDFY